MAVKDHSLDEKIIAAATSEFMEYGFQKASLHKIAGKAGLTTGALYTRYKGKDDLFCSLLQELLDDLYVEGEKIADLYLAVMEDPTKLLEVIRKEEGIYLDVLFRHYDACRLLFCKSHGSSIESRLQTLMDQKATQTVAYLKRISKTDEDLDGIELLMASQFQLYRQILERGLSREKAISCLQCVERFQEAGWRDLFQRIL